MSVSLPAGPYRRLSVDGTDVPWYVVPFDRAGRCEGPRTRDDLLRLVRSGDVTDVFLFSHGWNNDWATATGKYESFLAGYSGMRRRHRLQMGRDFRPVLAGVFWPSTALVAADERAPQIAADPAATLDADIAQERAEVREIATLLRPEDTERFYALVQAEKLDDDGAVELASLVAPVLDLPDDETGTPSHPARDGGYDAEAVAALWRRIPDLDTTAGDDDPASARAELEDFGTGEGGSGLAAAGLVDALRPRNVVRALTMWLMKDRAGTVGSNGVAELLHAVLTATGPRVHLVGHSFGAKVCLSALCRPTGLPRPVSSVLLLQPAVSHLCFADPVPGTSRAGGYAGALDRAERPILSMYSRHDVPLRRLFHLAARRRDDLGEIRIAGDEPDRFAALGGYGPSGVGSRGRRVDVKDLGDHYELGKGAPALYGVDASRTVSGHSDVSNTSTWWALYDLVRSG